ncbi:sigma-54-dependent transcriptional regulator [Mucilaginibacter myungsuensis]|uniref:Sigma-54-dependent Fis family transcriptional regulator n=1 Tax=Mucilaginibacter myungsuensis TaxID=649104 RepID=A0A929KX99_9SPHI|nr:sigma-54 dependent transcriptional regulator [Mucilaginibacter myungsuensis]MBE9662877.1 sigma-54-dependent Fis family transcriptional regulator [Mucilaginibacter myungsuensis]MDN3598297.1 sigma-54 dependent transcriptional regulator [Mucilaginibacter myungsuensis]
MARILLVEDDTTFAQLLEGFLTKKGHAATAVNNVKNGIRMLETEQFDLLLLDHRLPDGVGLDVLSKARENGSKIPAIVMTSFTDVRTAVRSMRAGAFDHITKPVNPDELMMIIGSALEQTDDTAADKPAGIPAFIKGESELATKLYNFIDIVAPTDMSVIIQGETGTGKENTARTIHQLSKREGKTFIAVDCGALSKELAASELFGHIKGSFTGAITDKKGVFEVADGGTLFLDEVGNLSYEVQVKLLRALQEKTVQPVGSTKTIPVNVRIISATNDDLAESVANGDFRQDLYHRLNEFKIQIPALREREDDLDLFIDHFIALSNKELGRNVKNILPSAKKILKQYDWPGNLRELKNVIKRMVLLTTSTIADETSLPEEMTATVSATFSDPGTDLKMVNEVNEKELIQKTLVKVKFNKSKAAKLLNIDRKTLYAKIERYGIDS